MITVNDVLLAMGNEAKMVENGLPVHYVESTMFRALCLSVGEFCPERDTGLGEFYNMEVPHVKDYSEKIDDLLQENPDNFERDECFLTVEVCGEKGYELAEAMGYKRASALIQYAAIKM